MLLWLNQRTAAAGRPYVQMSVNDYETGDAAGFSISFTNVGVGRNFAGVRVISGDDLCVV
jgi:hypothetical protein